MSRKAKFQQILNAGGHVALCPSCGLTAKLRRLLRYIFAEFCG